MSQNVPLIAPNEQDEIARTMQEHPEIDTMNEETRGEVITITAARLNGHFDRPWGRKARNNDPANPNLNTDGMTYLRPDGLFEIIDAISGEDGSATWDECGAFAPGENGYWYAVPGDEMGSGSDVSARLDAMQAQIDELSITVSEQGARLDDLSAKFDAYAAQPMRCHGPVDLPIVLESLTRLRAKGDIDVAVKPGEATPPPESSSTPPSVLDVVLLKKLLGRLRPDA